MKVNIDEINIHQLYTIYIHLLILRCYRIINIVFLFILDGIGFMKVIFYQYCVGNEWQSTIIESTIVG